MSIKGSAGELFLGKQEATIITFWGNKIKIPYDNLKRIDYSYFKFGDGGYSDLTPQLIGSTTSADGTISSANFSKYRFLIVRIGAGGWSRTEFFINQSYIGAFYALDNTANQRIRLDYDGNSTIRLSNFTGGSFNICEAYGFIRK